MQPRCTIPHDLSDIFAIHPKNLVDVFERWIIEVQLEKKQNDFDIVNYLLGLQTDRGEQAEKDNVEGSAATDQRPSAKEHGLMKLIDLAASIRRDGLSNPISLVQHGDHYEI